MSKTNLFQKLAPVGVAAFATAGSMLVPLPTNAQVGGNCPSFLGADINLWLGVPGETVICGDKEFEFIATDINPQPLDELFFQEINPLEYQLVYDFDPGQTSPFDFFLDYQVTVTDPDFFFSAVDLDTTVEGFPPDTSLVTTYTPIAGNPAGDPVELQSNNGNFDIEFLSGQSTTLLVENIYDGVNGTIDSFENSFEQEEHTNMVPEPASILGLLTIGGLGLGLKRKKQS